MGPAGTAHHALEGHALLIAELFMSENSNVDIDKLLAPYPDGMSDYALGWGVWEDDALGTVYVHSGSNTFWLSMLSMAPDQDLIVIVNTNQFDDGAQKAVQALSKELLEAYAEVDPR